jgi:uncharacterized membrane protein HdeD (DUF308 family)
MSAPGTSAAREPDQRTAFRHDGGPAVAPTAGPSARTSVQWAMLGLGVLAVLYGLLVVSLRPAALASIAVFAGVAFLVGGLVQLALAGGLSGGWRWWGFAGGALGIVAGVLAFVYPGLTLVVLAVLAAWAFVIDGVVRIVNSLTERGRDLWWLSLVAGVAELLLGLWAVGSPVREVFLLVNLIGIYPVVVGVDTAVTALTRPGRGSTVRPAA